MCAAWFGVFWYNYQLYELVLRVEQRATLPANWLTRMPFENAPPRFNQKMQFKSEPKNPIPIYRRSELIKAAMAPTILEMFAAGLSKRNIMSPPGRGSMGYVGSGVMSHRNSMQGARGSMGRGNSNIAS